MLMSIDKKAQIVRIAEIIILELKLEEIELPHEGPLTFHFEIEVGPEFELPEYKGIEVKRPSAQEPKTVSPEGMRVLCSYHWPGNIRELKNFVERVNIMEEEHVISASSVKSFLGAVAHEEANGAMAAYTGMTLGQARDSFERDLIEEKLKENGGNISRAAEALGLYASNLHSKMKKLRITAEK